MPVVSGSQTGKSQTEDWKSYVIDIRRGKPFGQNFASEVSKDCRRLLSDILLSSEICNISCSIPKLFEITRLGGTSGPDSPLLDYHI